MLKQHFRKIRTKNSLPQRKQATETEFKLFWKNSEVVSVRPFKCTLMIQLLKRNPCFGFFRVYSSNGSLLENLTDYFVRSFMTFHSVEVPL